MKSRTRTVEWMTTAGLVWSESFRSLSAALLAFDRLEGKPGVEWVFLRPIRRGRNKVN